MKKMFFLLIFFLPITAITQVIPINKNDSTTTAKAKPNFDSVINAISDKQNKASSLIDTIKANTDIIKENTKPAITQDFIKNKLLDKAYNFLFGEEGKPGLVPFLLSTIGLLLSFIRFLLLIQAWRKKISKKTQKGLSIITSFLLFVISFLMFIFSNRNFRSEEAKQLAKIESNVQDLQNSIEKQQKILSNNLNSSNEFAQLNINIQSTTAELIKLRNTINGMEQNVIDRIEEKTTNKRWIILNTVLLVLIICTFWTNVKEFFGRLF